MNPNFTARLPCGSWGGISLSLRHGVVEALGDGGQDRQVRVRAYGRIRVGRRAGDLASQLEELGSAVLVGRHRLAESEGAEVLEHVVQYEEARIAGRPEPIAQPERLRR